jgi:hypothetical protein
MALTNWHFNELLMKSSTWNVFQCKVNNLKKQLLNDDKSYRFHYEFQEFLEFVCCHLSLQQKQQLLKTFRATKSFTIFKKLWIQSSNLNPNISVISIARGTEESQVHYNIQCRSFITYNAGPLQHTGPIQCHYNIQWWKLLHELNIKKL